MSVNDRAVDASLPAMDANLPTRVELLLMRAFDGEASDAERAELERAIDLHPRLAALDALREALREALRVPGPVDVAGDVMQLLLEEDAWVPVGDALRGAFAGAPPMDVADAIMADLAVIRGDEAAPDEAAWAPFGAALADAVRAEAGPVDVWAGVAAVVASEPAGWEHAREQLRGALVATDVPACDVADDVMRRVGEGAEVVVFHAPAVDVPQLAPRRRMPMWASLGVPAAVLFAAAAAIALMFQLPGAPGVDGRYVMTSTFALASINDAHVEALETSALGAAQVMQFDDAPTIILVEEGG